jgi:hypothetical protein
MDWALTPTLAFETRYSRKRLDRTIEDAGIVTPNGEQFYITNPGFGINTQPVPATDCTACPNNPRAQRNYDSVEFRITRRGTGNWFGTFSYTYSRLYGNYGGLATADQSDALGRADPNVSRSFDEPYMQFDTTGHAINGPLPTDRPNTFKAFGYYNLKWLGMNTLIGMSQQIFEGTPLTSYLTLDGGSPQFVYNRGMWVDVTQDPTTGNWIASAPSARRTPWFLQTDLNLVHEIKVSKTHEQMRMGVEANILNLFNQRTVLNRDNSIMPQNIYGFTGMSSANIPNPPVPATSVSGVNYQALMTGYDWLALANNPNNNASLSSLYGQPNVWQAGRSMRFKIRFTF